MGRRAALGKIDDDLYKKFNVILNDELIVLSIEREKINQNLSNLSKYVAISLKLSSNLSSLWQKGNLTNRQNLQKLISPRGIIFDKETLTYRTEISNAYWKLITSFSDSLEEIKKEQTSVDADLSLLVARRGRINIQFNLIQID